MNKICLTLILIIFSSYSRAQNPSTLQISLSDGSAFSLQFDNQVIEAGERQITIANVVSGTHNFSILKLRRNSNGDHGSASFQPVYRATIQIEAATAVSYIVNIANSSHQSNTQKLYYSLNNSTIGSSATNLPLSGFSSFSPTEMSELKTAVDKSIIHSDKRKVIVRALRNRGVYAAQIRTIMDWLSFDTDKLVLAKTLFASCVDSQNYWKLADALSFSSSKNSLLAFVDAQQVAPSNE